MRLSQLELLNAFMPYDSVFSFNDTHILGLRWYTFIQNIINAYYTVFISQLFFLFILRLCTYEGT